MYIEESKKIDQNFCNRWHYRCRICKLKYLLCVRVVSLVIKRPDTRLFFVSCLRSSPCLSLKDCALLVKLFYKNNDCASINSAEVPDLVLKGTKKGVGPMIVQGLLKIIQKFEKSGSFAWTLDRFVSTMHKILRSILHWYCYQISHLQELFPSVQPARETFDLEFLACMEVD